MVSFKDKFIGKISTITKDGEIISHKDKPINKRLILIFNYLINLKFNYNSSYYLFGNHKVLILDYHPKNLFNLLSKIYILQIDQNKNNEKLTAPHCIIINNLQPLKI